MRVALTLVYRDVFQTHEGCKEGNVKNILTILKPTSQSVLLLLFILHEQSSVLQNKSFAHALF